MANNITVLYGNGVRKFQSFNEITSFIWGIADLLRGDYKQSDYGKVVLPFTVLRRLDCVLDATRQQVLTRYEGLQGGQVRNLDPILNRITGVPFHNTSRLSFDRLKDDPGHIAANVTSYIKGFSDNAREIFIERFKFPEQIQKLDEANLLYQVVCRFQVPRRDTGYATDVGWNQGLEESLRIPDSAGRGG
jgi:type I restriction enzyme M protein